VLERCPVPLRFSRRRWQVRSAARGGCRWWGVHRGKRKRRTAGGFWFLMSLRGDLPLEDNTLGERSEAHGAATPAAAQGRSWACARTERLGRGRDAGGGHGRLRHALAWCLGAQEEGNCWAGLAGRIRRQAEGRKWPVACGSIASLAGLVKWAEPKGNPFQLFHCFSNTSNLEIPNTILMKSKLFQTWHGCRIFQIGKNSFFD
jgi:hypothetical protein